MLIQQTLTTEDQQLLNNPPDDCPADLLAAIMSQDPMLYIFYDKATVFKAMFAYEEGVRTLCSPIRAERVLSNNAVLAAFRKALERLP